MRIDKLTSGSLKGLGWQQWGQWSRKAVTFLVLVAAVSALALIVEAQYGPQWREPAKALASLPEAGAADTDAQPSTAGAVLTPAQEGRIRALSDFVARRYRVSQGVAFDLVSHAHQVGAQLQLDPLLIIAVIAIESRFNPIAESNAGAKGLMQIIPKYHGDKLGEFGGEHAVFDPETNIEVGSLILREYIRRTGNLNIALQMYAGALGDHEDRYTRKVLNERQRLQQVLTGQNPPSRPAPVKATKVVSATNSLVVPSDLD